MGGGDSFRLFFYSLPKRGMFARCKGKGYPLGNGESGGLTDGTISVEMLHGMHGGILFGLLF